MKTQKTDRKCTDRNEIYYKNKPSFLSVSNGNISFFLLVDEECIFGHGRIVAGPLVVLANKVPEKVLCCHPIQMQQTL